MSEVEVNLFQPDGQYTEQGNALHEFLLEAHAEKRYDRLSEAEESFASMCVTHPIMTPGEWMRSHPNEVKEALGDMESAKNAQGGQQGGQGAGASLSAQQQAGIAEALSDFRSEFKNELTIMFDDFRQSLREGASPSEAGDGGGSGSEDSQEAMHGKGGGMRKRKRTRKAAMEDGDAADEGDTDE